MKRRELSSSVGVWGLVRGHWPRLLWPPVVMGLLGITYVTLKSEQWEATQGLVLRDTATNGSVALGKFSHPDALMTQQEMIIEIASRPPLVAAALRRVGPPATADEPATYPTAKEVEQFLEKMSLAPPKGAEPGKSEVLFLKVRGSTPERAKAIATAICDEMEARFQALRGKMVASIASELERTVALEEEALRAIVAKQAAMEAEVGSDLNELRNMSSLLSNNSDLQTKVLTLDAELRAAQDTQREHTQLLELVREAQNDSSKLLACPDRLLALQPGLERLKTGLVDSQLRQANLRGMLTEGHPSTRMAEDEVEEVNRHLRAELEAAERGLEAELKITAARMASLQEQVGQARQRLEHLASLSAEYGQLVAEAKHRTEILNDGQRRLAEARASEAAVRAASLISRLEEPYVGPEPAGPPKMLVLAASIGGGLLAGIGLVMLTIPPTARSGRFGLDSAEWEVLEQLLKSEARTTNGVHPVKVGRRRASSISSIDRE